MDYINNREIRELISVKDIINQIEDYYLNGGEEKSFIPERLFINDSDNTTILMPSFYENYYGIKNIGIALGNSQLGEPTLRGVFLLFERNRMKPLISMDARTITAMRTGAISGVGMRHLADEETDTIGIIGTGDQGFSHLQATCSVRKIKRVLVTNRSKERLEKFLERVEQVYPNIQFDVSEPLEILRESQIIITTSTSKNPVIPYTEEIDLTGKHFAGAGSFKPSMQEIPNYILKQANHIFVDSHATFEECGEMINARSFGYGKHNTPDLKLLVQGEQNDDYKKQITIFKSVGISIFDILTAKLIYERYRQIK